MATFKIGQRVKCVANDLKGYSGVVREAFYHRGEENSYRVEMQTEAGAKGLCGFAESELADTEPKQRQPREVALY